MPLRGWMVLATLALLLQGCAGQRGAQQTTPAQVRATVVALMPAATGDREGWAADIQTAFAAQKLDPSRSNLCAVLAVTEQESTYTADPAVAGLPKIARTEIERRAAALHVPGFLLNAALRLDAPEAARRLGHQPGSLSVPELARALRDHGAPAAVITGNPHDWLSNVLSLRQ